MVHTGWVKTEEITALPTGPGLAPCWVMWGSCSRGFQWPGALTTSCPSGLRWGITLLSTLSPAYALSMPGTK